MFQAVAEPHVVDEIGGGRPPCDTGPMVLYLEAAGTRNEVDVMAADCGVGQTCPVIQRESSRDHSQRLVDNSCRKKYPPVRSGLQPGCQQPSIQSRPTNFDPDGRQDRARFLQDPVQQRRARHRQIGIHGAPYCLVLSSTKVVCPSRTKNSARTASPCTLPIST